MTSRRAVLLVVGVVVSGCAGGRAASSVPSSRVVALTTAVTTTLPSLPPTTALVATMPSVPAPTAAATTTTTSTSAATLPTTTTTITSASDATLPPTIADEEHVIGESVDGRPITVRRRGTPGGVPVVVVGAIHGNEGDGVRVAEALAGLEVPAGVELWVLATLNPDGLAAGTRRNSHGVDLNRNFPAGWEPILDSTKQNAGPAPASEPETQAFIGFAEQIRPRLTVWYHQNLNAIAPSDGPDGVLRRRYSELSGVPIGPVSQPGGKYTGTASTWTRELDPAAMSFVVELPDRLTAADVERNAVALVEITRLVVASG